MKRTLLSLFAGLLATASAAQGLPMRGFEALFDDHFFSRRYEPFVDRWLAEGLDRPALQARTKETGEKVVVELRIPGLDAGSLDVSVDDSRIRVAYDAKEVRSGKDRSGREYFRGVSVRHFERIMPVPESADGRDGRIERDGDLVKIIFKRREFKADA